LTVQVDTTTVRDEAVTLLDARHDGAALRCPRRGAPWHDAGMHLAQLNVGRLRAPLDDPSIDDFRDNLDAVNALAEASPGFVWRLQDDDGNATGIKVFDDPLDIINLTVWESIDALADFTYRTGHVEFLRRRREFFEVPDQPILVLWWIPAGTIPTIPDALERLGHLRAHGPTPAAFTFRQRFGPGDAEATAGSELDTCPA
jgi:hypothetical protein